MNRSKTIERQGAWETWQTRLLEALATSRVSRWVPLVLGGLVFVVYLFTMAPQITWSHYGRDGGDFITAAWVLGVPHPPGYPTYTLLAWLFTHIPLGSVAWRVHLLSGLAATGTAVLVYFIVRRLTAERQKAVSILGSACGALLLAFAPLFWGHAIISEVYALGLFFVALILLLVLAWRDGRRTLPWAARGCGLGMGNDIRLVFLAPAILLLLWSGRERLSWRSVLWSGVALLGGLLVYLYLPWRASQGPIINWGDPDTWRNFRWVITGEGYQKFFFGVSGSELGSRLVEWVGLTGAQFPFLVWPIAGVGLWGLARQDRWLALGTGIHALLGLIFSVGYSTTDAFVYMLPVFFYVAFWTGLGAVFLLDAALDLSVPRRGPSFVTGLVIVGLVLMPAISLVEEWGGMDLTHDRDATDFAVGALNSVEPNALIVVGSDAYTFSLWYYHYVEGLRPDVIIVNYAMLTFDWYQDTIAKYYPQVEQPPPSNAEELRKGLAVANMDQRAVYVTEKEGQLEGLANTPAGPLLRVTAP
jgi:hypothetical protein